MLSDKMEHRINELEKDRDFDRATAKKDFDRITALLSEASSIMCGYGEKLKNLWEWKLYQNGLLTDIRDEQRRLRQMMDALWLKIAATIIISLVINYFFGK